MRFACWGIMAPMALGVKISGHSILGRLTSISRKIPPVHRENDGGIVKTITHISQLIER